MLNDGVGQHGRRVTATLEMDGAAKETTGNNAPEGAAEGLRMIKLIPQASVCMLLQRTLRS
jgi:hypothetical protein